MVALEPGTLRATTDLPGEEAGGRRLRIRWSRAAVLLVAALYFVGPLAAAFWFSIHSGRGFTFHAYTQFYKAPGFIDAITLSLEVSLLTVALSLALMIPTMLLVHLRYPRVRPLVEVLSLLPLVVPPIVLIVGVSRVIAWGNTTNTATARFQIVNQLLNSHPPMILPLLYVILALPFTYRSIDAGLQTAGITTVVEAARNLGAGWWVVLWRVVLPTLRTSVLNASFLIFALAFGEFTVASLLQLQPFAVWLLQFNNSDGQLTVGLSLLSLGITWMLLVVMSVSAGRMPSAPRSKDR